MKNPDFQTQGQNSLTERHQTDMDDTTQHAKFDVPALCPINFLPIFAKICFVDRH